MNAPENLTLLESHEPMRDVPLVPYPGTSAEACIRAASRRLARIRMIAEAFEEHLLVHDGSELDRDDVLEMMDMIAAEAEAGARAAAAAMLRGGDQAREA